LENHISNPPNFAPEAIDNTEMVSQLTAQVMESLSEKDID